MSKFRVQSETLLKLTSAIDLQFRLERNWWIIYLPSCLIFASLSCCKTDWNSSMSSGRYKHQSKWRTTAVLPSMTSIMFFKFLRLKNKIIVLTLIHLNSKYTADSQLKQFNCLLCSYPYYYEINKWSANSLTVHWTGFARECKLYGCM